MEMTLRPSPSYSLALRIEYPNNVGNLGLVTSAIGENGGDIGAIDIISSTRQTVVRDITFSASDHEHGRRIIEAVRAIPGIDIVQVSDRTFLLHLGGKLEIHPKVPVKSRDDISMVYVPGVARIAQAVADDPEDAYNLTIKKNTVGVVSDGSVVLGLGNVGPFAALPVMEGKAILFKEFAGVDAFPICLDTQSVDEIVTAVRAISPTFGAIHLEDIDSPRCFEIERRLTEELPIPVMHNDQHGTAIVVLAALMNAFRLTGRSSPNTKIVIHGAGAAGIATVNLLMSYGARDVVLCDEQGAIHAGRESFNNDVIRDLAGRTNPRGVQGSLAETLRGADVFIGFGRKTILQASDIAAMNSRPIVFVMAYPHPEVQPESIADITPYVASGRSDLPNQLNNMLCFPGFFRGLLDVRATRVVDSMKLAAAHAIADIIGRDELHEDYLVPSVFDRRVVKAVASAVGTAAREAGVARRPTKSPLR